MLAKAQDIIIMTCNCRLTVVVLCYVILPLVMIVKVEVFANFTVLVFL